MIVKVAKYSKMRWSTLPLTGREEFCTRAAAFPVGITYMKFWNDGSEFKTAEIM